MSSLRSIFAALVLPSKWLRHGALEGVNNPTTPDGFVHSMPADFQAAFIDAQGTIVGYGHIDVLVDASGKTRIKVVE